MTSSRDQTTLKSSTLTERHDNPKILKDNFFRMATADQILESTVQYDYGGDGEEMIKFF
jgi:hypothetical protein